MAKNPTLKGNRFYDNRAELKRIMDEQDCNDFVAVSALATEKGWTGWQGEANDFRELVAKYIRDPNLKLEDLWK